VRLAALNLKGIWRVWDRIGDFQRISGFHLNHEFLTFHFNVIYRVNSVEFMILDAHGNSWMLLIPFSGHLTA